MDRLKVDDKVILLELRLWLTNEMKEWMNPLHIDRISPDVGKVFTITWISTIKHNSLGLGFSCIHGTDELHLYEIMIKKIGIGN